MLFSYLQQTYTEMDILADANIYVGKATRHAYACIVESLKAHSATESLESVRIEVQAAYNASIEGYHTSSTDAGKRGAIEAMMIYKFFLFLSQSPMSELPF